MNTAQRPSYVKKTKIIEEIVDRLNNNAGFVIANYKTMTVAEMSELRKLAKQSDCIVKVYKDKLFLRALEQLNYSGLAPYMTEQNIFIFSKENIAAAKLVANFKKKYKKLELKAGIVDKQVMDTKAINEIALLPSKEELYSMFASALIYPLRQFMLLTKEIAKTRAE